MIKAMENLRILDMSSILAGPLVGSFFAELGATVIKVENALTQGDATRQWKLPSENEESPISAYYASANHGKQLLLLNLKDDADYQRLIEEVKQCDVLISNFQEHRAADLKIDFNELSKVKPDIIYAQLYAYEPGDKRPGYDLVMQAETGFMSMNGHPDGAPAKMPVALIDVLAAHQMKESILLALLQRSDTAQHLRVSLYQSAVAALANQGSNYINAGHVPQRMGSLHPNIAPYGDSFQSQDGIWFILAVGSDHQFHKLGKTLNSDTLLSSNFTHNNDRVQQRKALQKALQSEFQQLPYSQIESQLRGENIPFCLICTVDQVFQNPLAQSMIKENDMEGQQAKYVSQIAFDIQSEI